MSLGHDMTRNGAFTNASSPVVTTETNQILCSLNPAIHFLLLHGYRKCIQNLSFPTYGCALVQLERGNGGGGAAVEEGREP